MIANYQQPATNNQMPFRNIDEYIASFPVDTQIMMEELREIIRKAAPKAEEAIKYAMPSFVYNGNLVHFAAYKKHIGLYAVPNKHPDFEPLLAGYKTGSGSIQFPLGEPLPKKLITAM